MNYDTIVHEITADIEANDKYLHLTPNENVVSESAKRFNMSDIASRYNFGPAHENNDFTLFHGFTSLAKNGINHVVDTTQRQLSERLHAYGAIFAPLSGLHAMMISVFSLTQIGDVVYSLDPSYGGHFATIGIIKNAGRESRLLPMDTRTLDIDYDAFATQVARIDRPICLYIDMSYSLIPFDVARLRQAVGPNNRIVFDASHVFGLILGGTFPNPLDCGADVISANTHKTLPGTHKGIILCKSQGIFSHVDNQAHGYYSSTHLDHTIGLCISVQEMLSFGEQYAHQIIENARALADGLTKRGLVCRRADDKEWTYTHQVHLMTSAHGSTEDIAKYFFSNHIAVAFDEMYDQGAFIRLGVQEITRRGAQQEDMDKLADILSRAIHGEDVQKSVVMMLEKFSKVHYSFDIS